MATHTATAAGGHAPAGDAAPHWETSAAPLVCALGILLLLPGSFIAHFVYHHPLLAVLFLGIGVPVTVWGVSCWVREAIAGHGEGLALPAMGWFILAEALIFVGLFAAYWFMRLTAPQWPPQGSVPLPKAIPMVMTVLLIASSVTFHFGEAAHVQGRPGSFIGWLAVTMVLGAAFLSLSGYEWSALMAAGFEVGTNAQSTAFYSITGFHGAHVIVGLGLFTAVLLPALAGRTNPHFVGAAGLYWHFVDIVWLFVVSQVYFW